MVPKELKIVKLRVARKQECALGAVAASEAAHRRADWNRGQLPSIEYDWGTWGDLLAYVVLSDEWKVFYSPKSVRSAFIQTNTRG